MTIIKVTNTSTQIQSGSEKAPYPVQVQLDDYLIDASHMLNVTTFRLIIFDPNVPPSGTSKLLYNAQVCDIENMVTTGSWGTSYRSLYDFAQNLLYSYGDPENLFFLFATNGFDVGMVPPPSFVELLFRCGAGAELQKWLRLNPGQSHPERGWVLRPANYIFIGSSGTPMGSPLMEKFETIDGPGPLVTTATWTFPGGDL